MSDSKFWANEDDWFDDAYGYVFLARALKAAGKALYPAEWTGTEPLTREPLSDLWFVVGGRKFPQPRSSVSGPSVAEVRRLLLIHAPEKLEEQLSTNARRLQPLRTARDASRGSAAVYGTPRMELTDQSWTDGVEVAAHENERRQAALDRYAGAQKFLKDAIRDGKLKFVLLPLRGGQPFSPPMPAEWWNVKDVSNRFYKCQMDPGKPDSPHIGGDRWIFVDGGDLEKLLVSISPVVGSGIPIWRQIADMKIKDTSLVRGDIAKRFPALSEREFGRHWKRAAEALPDLKKAGRPPRKST
ncbi:hypothetical protein E0H93_17580 [Rhizobium leguminosarum bv. viciae]|uniref:hypothetical protein n=1 Tax=Rhizobium leguminosarum TaxID=384 RepID=UPI00103F326A|nr:hypothetical protein [Rhizobium leguminosarum]TCB05134.1 hypothetical protein E0H93_17580 [Rhizobium leguminosarum bv. viciae]